jgi:hypothetical protein
VPVEEQCHAAGHPRTVGDSDVERVLARADAAAIWALITLHRVRVGQEALRARLDAIERLLPRA